ncbi:hypothetical protein M5689_000610 [Euphorbia peplus]|nr:hypothetical protein M5689_000610 [Euphorbia peplus]
MASDIRVGSCLHANPVSMKCSKNVLQYQTSNWNNVNNCLKFPTFNFNTLENHPSPFSSTRFGDAEMKFYNGRVHHRHGRLQTNMGNSSRRFSMSISNWILSLSSSSQEILV